MEAHVPNPRLVSRDEGGGEPDLTAELTELVYNQLRDIARRMMARERVNHTLQPTALVHEAYQRLQDGTAPPWKTKSEFFQAAAVAMQRILVDHARQRQAKKRGGGKVQNIEPEEMTNLSDDRSAAEILCVDEAVSRINGYDSNLGLLIRLRFFAGLSVDQTAEIMGVARHLVVRDWKFARALLCRELRESRNGSNPE